MTPSPPRDLRARILAVATRMFATQGYGATSLREVAEACECTKPALYHYFSSKQELYTAACEGHCRDIGVMLEDLATAQGPFTQRLSAALNAFKEHIEANRDAIVLIRRAEIHSERGQPELDVAGIRRKHIAVMEDVFRQGIEQGAVRSDVDPRDCAIAASGLFEMRLQLWLEGEPWPTDLYGSTIALLFEGISP